MRRILVVATRQIGDVLLTTPLIRAARERWPGATIDVLGLGGTLGLVRGNPDVSELIETARGAGWRANIALVRRLWRRYDLVLVTQQSDRAHLFGFVAGRERSGIVPTETRHGWWKRRLLRHAVVSAGDRGEVHSAREKLALLDPWRRVGSTATQHCDAGAHDGDARDGAPLLVPPAGTPLPGDLAAVLGAVPIVVHAPSMWRYKQWPVEHYAQVVTALLDAGHHVVLTGGDSAGDRQKVEPLAALAAPPALIDVAGRLDWNQVATLLSRAALFIGPDTSVTHLAAALGVPVIALFGPSNPMRWGPLGATAPGAPPYARRSAEPQRRGNVVLLQGPRPCVPCGRAGCDDQRDSRSACLEAIGPSQVIDEARRVLAAPRPAASISAPAATAAPMAATATAATAPTTAAPMAIATAAAPTAVAQK